MTRTLALAVLLSVCVFAQASIDGITTSASRTINLPPDNATFMVTVTAASGSTVPEIAAWLGSAGITAANLVSAGTTSGLQLMGSDQLTATRVSLVYVFQVSVPYGGVRDMIRKLEEINSNPALGGPRLTYGFSLAASDAAIQDARRKALPDLYADARRRAEHLAETTALSVGTIQAVTDNTYTLGVTPQISTWLTGGNASSSGGLQVTVSVTVRFSANTRSY